MLSRHVGRVSAIFDGTLIGVALWSVEGRLLHANPKMCDLFQRAADDLIGESLFGFVDPAFSDVVGSMLADLIVGSRASFECALRCRQANGSALWLRAHVTGVYGGGTSPEYVISQIFSFTDVRSRSEVVDDVRIDDNGAPSPTRWDKVRTAPRPALPHKRWTDEVEMDTTAGRHLSQLANALDASTDFLLFIESDMFISHMNEAATEALGIARDEDSGTGPVHLMDVLTGDASELFHGVVQPALVFDSIWRGELDLKAKDDRSLPVSVVFHAQTGSDGRIESITAIARDITDLKAAQVKLQALATHDYLTGLENRVLLYTRLEQALARLSRYGHPVAMMYIDLDEFKAVNDRMGHHVGDQVLMAVADRIHSVIRVTDSAARLGGDEFAVLVEGVVDARQHKTMADRLITLIGAPIVVDDVTAIVGASIGIVQADPTCTSPDALMALADKAMYSAKGSGKGCSVIVDGTGRAIG